MRRIRAGCLVASWALMFGTAQASAAQAGGAAGVWNDPRSRALVERATQRRAEQLADTGLADYRAEARGYVTFLAALGDGFLETPKVVKTDELAVEVYWHAPNRSKQRIIGRRDTLLLPTDIQYHRDHLAIVLNNFPDFIRIGDGGDEVHDVPHPLSRAGLALYDFQLSGDSIRIRLADRQVDLLEVRVRPKNDREPRVIGSIFIDPTEGQVVRMAFNFTHAAFIDQNLEDLAIVLENRLIGSRYWLPSRQEIEIRRTGTWMDFPVRGIIRGRWEIGEYQINQALATQTFIGPEIDQAPPLELKKYPWQGTILDSLPPDVRATVDPDIQRVLAEARVLVRAQALARAQPVRASAHGISDFVRVNRVEGLAIGGGVTAKLFSNFSFTGRARYGFDDRAVKGLAQLRWEQASGNHVDLFGSRDHVDIGDQPERSSIVNSFAAQEFGSDLTDPYRVDEVGLRAGQQWNGMDLGLSVGREWHRDLQVHATPLNGRFDLAPAVRQSKGDRIALTAYHPSGAWLGPGQLQVAVRLSLLYFDTPIGIGNGAGPPVSHGVRGSMLVEHRSQRGSLTLLLREQIAAAFGYDSVPPQELAYFGGPISAPGYDLHSVAGPLGSATRLEVQVPIPFFGIPLGRFGRIPGQAHLAPYASNALVGGTVTCAPLPTVRCPTLTNGGYPSVGIGLLTIFDVLRFDVARGLRTGGWMFNLDVSRDFWSVL
jgi:hypothetical protein